MSKLSYIPKWLNEKLAQSEIQIDSLENVSLSTILSKYDIINYTNAQVEFFKLITDNYIDNYNDFKYIFETTMNVPDLSLLDECLIYLKDNYNTPVNNEPLLCGEDVLYQCKYRLLAATSNKFAYIIGGNDVVSNLIYHDNMVANVNSRDLILGIIECLFRGFRVETVETDRSSTFRDNRFLTQLYVKQLCAQS